MIAQKIALNGVFGVDKETTFSFNTKSSLKSSEFEAVLQALESVLFGSKKITSGSVRFYFEENGASYILVRDFDGDKLSLRTVRKDSQDISEDHETIEAFIRDLLPCNEQNWKQFCTPNLQASYESVFSDTKEFVEGYLANMDITDSSLSQSKEALEQNVSHCEGQLDALAEITGDFDEETSKQELNALQTEIDQITRDEGILSDIVSAGAYAQHAIERLTLAEKELASDESWDKHIDKIKETIDRSNHIKDQLVFLDKIASARKKTSDIEKKIAKNNKKITSYDKEILSGEETLDVVKKEFIETSSQVKALHSALDELIEQNVLEGKSDKLVTDEVEKFLKSQNKDIASLRAEEDKYLARLAKLDQEIAQLHAEFNIVHFTYEKKEAIRNSKITKEKANELDRMKAIIDALHEQNEKHSFDLQQAVRYNQDALTKAQETTVNQVKRDIAPKDYTTEYNTLEQLKQSLYRNQILCSSLLQDINAIDKKINENNEATRTTAENLGALENAKKTLLDYLEKSKEKIAEEDKIVLSLNAQLRFLAEIDSLEYGKRCPLCDGPVTEKLDTSDANNDIQAQLDESNQRTADLRNQIAEYDEKLTDINLKIGSMQAKIDTTKGYIDSLEKTKLVKVATINKIYSEASVRNQDELGSLLEDVIKRMRVLANFILADKENTSTQAIAGQNIGTLEKILSDYDNNLLQVEQNVITATQKEIEDDQKEFDTFMKDLAGYSNDEWVEMLKEAERAEDGLFSHYEDLIDQKLSLLASLDELRNSICRLSSRYLIIESEGKEYSYGQLCILFAGKQYSSILAEIRLLEQQKLALQDQIVAMSRVVEEKRNEREKFIGENTLLQQQREVNIAFEKTLSEKEPFDREFFNTVSVETFHNEILDEEKEQELKKAIAEHEEKYAKDKAHYLALQRIVEESRPELDNYASGVDALVEIRNVREEKLKEYYQKIRFAELKKHTVQKSNEQRALLAELTRQIEVVTLLQGDKEQLFSDLVNEELSKLLPPYRIQLTDNNRIELLVKGKKDYTITNSIDDETYTVFNICMFIAITNMAKLCLEYEPFLILPVKEKAVANDKKDKLFAYAQKKNIVLLFTK